MSYFIFRQNNSGGYFTGPSLYFVVNADDADTANNIAVANGLYFDGKGDCDCCGYRWTPVTSAEATDTLPTITEHDKKYSLADDVTAIIIV